MKRIAVWIFIVYCLSAMVSIAADPQSAFDPMFIKPLVDKARGTTVKEIYFLLGGDMMETNACDTLIYWNNAAKSIFTRDAGCIIEISAYGFETVSEQFKSLGIAEGYTNGKLYISVHPKYAKNAPGERLIFEHWTLDAKPGREPHDAVIRGVATKKK